MTRVWNSCLQWVEKKEKGFNHSSLRFRINPQLHQRLSACPWHGKLLRIQVHSFQPKHKFSKPVMVGLFSIQMSPGGFKAAELLLGQHRRALTPVTGFSLASPALRCGLGVQPWVWCPTLSLQHHGHNRAGSGPAELFTVQEVPGCPTLSRM